MYAPDRVRKENDVEHSYLLTMLCWYLVDAFQLALDKQKIFQYGLAHDIVEAYAGDTHIFDTEGRKSKHEREESARLRIAEEFPEFTDLHKSIKQYEQRADAEVLFVYEVDKLIPFITNYLQEGHGWKRARMRPDELFAHKREKITHHPELRTLLEQFIAELEPRLKDFFYER